MLRLARQKRWQIFLLALVGVTAFAMHPAKALAASFTYTIINNSTIQATDGQSTKWYYDINGPELSPQTFTLEENATSTAVGRKADPTGWPGICSENITSNAGTYVLNSATIDSVDSTGTAVCNAPTQTTLITQDAKHSYLFYQTGNKIYTTQAKVNGKNYEKLGYWQQATTNPHIYVQDPASTGTGNCPSLIFNADPKDANGFNGLYFSTMNKNPNAVKGDAAVKLQAAAASTGYKNAGDIASCSQATSVNFADFYNYLSNVAGGGPSFWSSIVSSGGGPEGEVKGQAISLIGSSDLMDYLQIGVSGTPFGFSDLVAPNGTQAGDYRSHIYSLAQTTEGQSILNDLSAANGGGKTVATACDTILGDNGLRWLLCPVVTMLSGAISAVSGILQGLLSYDLAGQNGVYLHSAWSSFRNISLSLIVVAGLVMVVSELLGFSFVDAYTIRKLLPRLLVAIIGITLSWAIISFIIGFFNDIGNAIGNIILSPFQAASAAAKAANGIGGGFGNALAGAVGVGATGYGIYAGGVALGSSLGVAGIISLLFTVVLGIIVGLAIIGLRTAIISLCIIIAPLAIASYILPGTKKLWDFWKDTLTSMLILFPIVIAMMAAGQGVASIIGHGGGVNGVLAALVLVASLLSLLIAPKLAGGLAKTVFSMANDRSKGIFDRNRKFRGDIKQARTQQEIDGKRTTFTSGFKQRAAMARHGHAISGGGFQGARKTQMEQSTLESVKKAGSLGANDEINRRVASGMSEHDFVTDRSAEVATSLQNGWSAANSARLAKMAPADASAERDKAYAQLRTQAHNQAEVEAGQVHAAYGAFGSQAAMDSATRAKLSSASAYNNTRADGSADPDADYQELYADVGRMMERGSISSGDGIGMIKGYMQNRPDMKGAAAGVTLGSLEEARAGLRAGKLGGPLNTSTIRDLQDSSVKNMTSSQFLQADARSARNSAPALLRDLNKKRNLSTMAQAKIDDAQRTFDAAVSPADKDTARQALVATTMNNGQSIRDYKQAMARMANIQDGLSSSSVEVGQHYSNILAQGSGEFTMDGKGDRVEMTNIEAINKMRGDEEFQQFRREYPTAAAAGGGQAGDPPTTTPSPTAPTT